MGEFNEGTNRSHAHVSHILVQGSDGEGDEVVVQRRRRLKREGSMLKTMFCATVRASKLVSAVRCAPLRSFTLYLTIQCQNCENGLLFRSSIDVIVMYTWLI